MTHSCGARQVNTAYGKDKETAVKAETLKKAALMVQEEMLALLQVWWSWLAHSFVHADRNCLLCVCVCVCVHIYIYIYIYIYI